MGTAVREQGKGDISVVLCGQAGQGVQTVEFVLTRLMSRAGYQVFATKEYMSRIRGGANSTTIRISPRTVAAPVDRIDLLIPLNEGAVEHVARRISAKTVVLGERQITGDVPILRTCTFFDVPFTAIASAIGNKLYSNVVAVGAIAGLLGIGAEHLRASVRHFFAGKPSGVVEDNVKAADEGYAAVAKLGLPHALTLSAPNRVPARGELLLNGGEAVGMGAIAGGCNFVSSYPMSPSTPVLTFLAQHAKDFGLIVEQAEDEIAAVNMAIGAWYAGARALVTTSGGGFALMTEGLSLAGMLESPLVIHLAQRPGPATGLPTRTEQADLEMAVYAGHGEFPRIILAPGTLEDGFCLTQRAFDLADKYQVPVFILTDQYYIDSYYSTPVFELSRSGIEKHVVSTSRDYRRYELVATGVSPRGVPGYGEGLVVVDSDEHDEEGHITEDAELRVRMVDKRLAKEESLMGDAVPPELVGPPDYRNLVICWGSTYHAVKEAVSRLERDDTAMLHYRQVYPVPADTTDYLRRAERTVIVEGNATAQFRRLIQLQTGISVMHQVLSYDGLGFSVERIIDRLGDILA